MQDPLEQLIPGVPTDAFLANHWPERHGVFHGSLDRLPEFFRSPLLLDPRELSKAYRGDVWVTHRGSTGQHLVSGAEARAYFEDLGVSVRFEDVDRLLPGAPEWIRRLEAALGVPRGAVFMGAFVNAVGSGLVPHCDHHEGFLVHIRGTKVFRVTPHPTTRFAHMMHSAGRPVPPEWLAQAKTGLPAWRELPDTATEHRLQPGSVIFMPRGLYHQTRAEEDISVSVTLVVRTPTPMKLLSERIAGFLGQSEAWRTPLVRAWGAEPAYRDQARDELQRLLVDLGARIARLSPESLLEHAATGALETKDCTDRTRFQRDANIEFGTVPRSEEHVEATVESGPHPSERVSKKLPAALAPALAWLEARRTSFTFAELCAAFDGWEASSLAAVMTFLVRARAFVVLPFDPYDDGPAPKT